VRRLEQQQQQQQEPPVEQELLAGLDARLTGLLTTLDKEAEQAKEEVVQAEALLAEQDAWAHDEAQQQEMNGKETMPKLVYIGTVAAAAENRAAAAARAAAAPAAAATPAPPRPSQRQSSSTSSSAR